MYNDFLGQKHDNINITPHSNHSKQTEIVSKLKYLGRTTFVRLPTLQFHYYYYFPFILAQNQKQTIEESLKSDTITAYIPLHDLILIPRPVPLISSVLHVFIMCICVIHVF